jgi:hypothetical protein
MVVVGRHCARNLGNAVADCVATVRELVCRLVLVLARGAAPRVLLKCVGCFHQRFKVLLGERVVGLDGGGMPLSIEHFVLVKIVAVIHLLQIKVEFVVIRDRDVGADEHALVIVEALPKGGRMFVTVTPGVVCVFQHLLHFDVKGAPAIVQVFQDLEGGDLVICRKAMLQLGIILFVKGVM